MSLLLKNASIIDSNFECMENAYLGIDGKFIKYIGKEKPTEKYTEEKDMSGKVLLPGFVNVHGHAAMVQLRGMGSNLSFKDWLIQADAIEDTMTSDDFLAGMRLAILEMLASGTTSFSDMYMFELECTKAIEESGIKANLSRGFCGGFDGEDYLTSPRRTESLELFNKYNGTYDDRLRVDFSVHAEYSTTENFVRALAEEVKDLRGARMQIHLSESKLENEGCMERHGKTPTQFFRDCGLFDIPTYAAHCVWPTDEDLEIIKEKKVSIVHCPESNLKLGNGIAQIKRMLDMGITVGLGTDGAASNNNLNMLEEMHLASILHFGLSAADSLKLATQNGALIQGRPDTGVLEVGKKADIIAIDLDRPHLHPNLDTLALIAYAAQGSDVCMTMVDGKVLYENGEFKTLDKERIIYEAEQSVKRLYGN